MDVDAARDAPGAGPALSRTVDAVVAAVVVLVLWAPQLVQTGDGTRAAGLGLALAVAAAVLLRRRFPAPATAAALAATAAGWALGVSTDPMLAAAWCLYPLALRRGAGARLVDALTVGLLVLGTGVLGVTATVGGPGQRIVFSLGVLGAAWLFGRAEAERLESARRGVRRLAELEQTRRRTAMAREVHDVVGHALGVISAEADVARNLPGADERELRESLADIEQRARGALEEVQALVRALRDGRSGAEEAGGGTARALPELVAAARASGLEVTVRTVAPDLPREADLVAARVVREALSNVVRHAGARRCEIAVWTEGETVTVRVEDDGSGLPRAPREGTGLTGMRERVEEAGGRLTVTDRLTGGARVLAELPLEARR